MVDDNLQVWGYFRVKKGEKLEFVFGSLPSGTVLRKMGQSIYKIVEMPSEPLKDFKCMDVSINTLDRLAKLEEILDYVEKE